jgi:integrase
MGSVLIRGTRYTSAEDVIGHFELAYLARQPLSTTESTLVRSWTTAVQPSSVLSAWNTISALVKFLRAAEGMDWPLEPDRLFAPRNVEWYCAKILVTNHAEVRATERSRLRAVAKAVSIHQHPPPWAATYPRRTPKSPYDDQCIFDYVRLSEFQSTQYRKRILRAHLALCVGAGLRTTEMVRITSQHIRTRGAHLLIEVPGRHPRAVPVRHEFQDMLARLTEKVPSGPLVGREHDGVLPIHHNLKAAIEIPDWLPALQTSRLRATWIVWCLNNNVPLPSLLYMAGVNDLQIGAWTPHLNSRPEPAIEHALFAGAAA